jgi:hypothetical protein
MRAACCLCSARIDGHVTDHVVSCCRLLLLFIYLLRTVPYHSQTTFCRRWRYLAPRPSHVSVVVATVSVIFCWIRNVVGGVSGFISINLICIPLVINKRQCRAETSVVEAVVSHHFCIHEAIYKEKCILLIVESLIQSLQRIAFK